MSTDSLKKSEIAAIVSEAVAAAMKAHISPLLLDQTDSATYCGLPRSTWFRLRAQDELPKPVNVPGTGLRWRRRDLDNWLVRLKPSRRK